DLLELGEGGKEFTSRGEAPDMDAYRAFAVNSKVVAIGECGLDYYRPEEGSIAIQKKVFESLIDLAVEANKPLMLHLRNGSGRSAYHEAYDILKNENGITGNLHFFAGNIEETKLFLDLGFSFSFTGVITFARDYDEVIRYLPMDRIMSETDCPYVAPKPYRGKKNEPAYVLEVVKALAGIRGESEEMVTKQIIKNAERVFNVNCKNQNVK
ncbi:MAG: TatD family hydrolase, partial [Candidatus Taylorbacteria bacterium]|nr:TatD family hydrolase [Candidatus Taylorbacteria bacterium]